MVTQEFMTTRYKGGIYALAIPKGTRIRPRTLAKVYNVYGRQKYNWLIPYPDAKLSELFADIDKLHKKGLIKSSRLLFPIPDHASTAYDVSDLPSIDRPVFFAYALFLCPYPEALRDVNIPVKFKEAFMNMMDTARIFRDPRYLALNIGKGNSRIRLGDAKYSDIEIRKRKDVVDVLIHRLRVRMDLKKGKLDATLLNK